MLLVLVSIIFVAVNGMPPSPEINATIDEMDFDENSTIAKMLTKRSDKHYCSYRKSRLYAYEVDFATMNSQFVGWENIVFIFYRLKYRGFDLVTYVRGLNGPKDNHPRYGCETSGPIGSVQGCPDCNMVCIHFDPHNKERSPNSRYKMAFDKHQRVIEPNDLTVLPCNVPAKAVL
uniref:Uncharacterized protein n=1 Tax=Romanomermis culicivorax TaxID=13658 RepID=A0A915IDR9_ROMCU